MPTVKITDHITAKYKTYLDELDVYEIFVCNVEAHPEMFEAIEKDLNVEQRILKDMADRKETAEEINAQNRYDELREAS